jgi:outer membrane protein TolC
MITTTVFGSTTASRTVGKKTTVTAKTPEVTVQSNNAGELTVDEAVKKAIAYSHDLKTLNENLTLAEDDVDDANSDLHIATEYADVKRLDVQLKNLRKNIQSYTADTEIQKEKIRLSVIEYFAAIIHAEKQLELYEENMEIQSQQIEISKIKLEAGIISQNEYDNAVTSYNKTVSEKQSLEIATNNAYTSLNKLFGDDLNTRYTISLDIDYVPFDGNLSSTVNKAVSSSQKVIEAEQTMNIAKYEYDVHSGLYSTGSKEEKLNAYAKATRDLADTKTNVETSITNVYNNILTLENTYKTNKDNLEQKEKDLEILKLKAELGKATELEVKQAEYEIKKLEADIQNSIYTHYVLTEEFSNPDLI